jgi:hypothetical protein
MISIIQELILLYLKIIIHIVNKEKQKENVKIKRYLLVIFEKNNYNKNVLFRIEIV